MTTHDLAHELLQCPDLELEIEGWIGGHGQKIKVKPCDYNDGETFILVAEYDWDREPTKDSLFGKGKQVTYEGISGTILIPPDTEPNQYHGISPYLQS